MLVYIQNIRFQIPNTQPIPRNPRNHARCVNSINTAKPNQHEYPQAVAMVTSDGVHQVIISGCRTGVCSINTQQTTLSAEIATCGMKMAVRRPKAIRCQSTVSETCLNLRCEDRNTVLTAPDTS